MVYKLDVGGKKGKSFHLELSEEASKKLEGKKLKDIVKGSEIKRELDGFEFIITGASDKQGFPALEIVSGPIVKRILLKRGPGMKKKKPKGLIRRKSIHGDVISKDIVQINLRATKEPQPLEEVLGKKEEAKTSLEKKPEEKRPAEEKGEKEK